MFDTATLKLPTSASKTASDGASLSADWLHLHARKRVSTLLTFLDVRACCVLLCSPKRSSGDVLLMRQTATCRAGTRRVEGMNRAPEQRSAPDSCFIDGCGHLLQQLPHALQCLLICSAVMYTASSPLAAQLSQRLKRLCAAVVHQLARDTSGDRWPECSGLVDVRRQCPNVSQQLFV